MIFTWPVAQPTKPIPAGYKFGRSRTLSSGEKVTHKGVDIGGPATGGREGEPVWAAAPGKVTVSRMLSSGGYAVYVKHDATWQTRYYHVQDPARVKVGAQVARGQHIANVGRTGISNSPAHLHFEVRKGSSAVDPLNHLTAGGGTLPLIAAAAAAFLLLG
jgi:murein DD-endopeptidase MepM/ murein hydrolase activator NlpD